jgi:hypothetical protein
MITACPSHARRRFPSCEQHFDYLLHRTGVVVRARSQKEGWGAYDIALLDKEFSSQMAYKPHAKAKGRSGAAVPSADPGRAVAGPAGRNDRARAEGGEETLMASNGLSSPSRHPSRQRPARHDP